MIMIRSNATAQKINKPPPPVPPRPAKSLVQEALAKSRLHQDGRSKENKTQPIVRQAPPPPLINNKQAIPNNEIVKSNSSYTVNVSLKKPSLFSRSISEEKCTRPVIYQSSNVRNTSKVEVKKDTIENSRNLKRVESFDKNKDVRDIKRNDSFKNTQTVQLTIANKNRSSFVVNDDHLLDSEEELQKDGCNEKGSPKSKDSTLEKLTISTDRTSESCSSSNSSKSNSLDKKWDKMLNDRNHVNTLIDEMFASVLEVSLTSGSDREKSPSECSSASENNKIVINNKIEDLEDPVPTTVIVISDEECSKSNKSCYSSEPKSNTSTNERKIKFDDQMNHEILITELQNMKSDQSKILKRQRKPSVDIYDNDNAARRNSDNIHMNDWFSVSDSGEEVKLSTCQITIEGDGNGKDDSWSWKKENGVDYERISKMSHLHGLPPLPKSLSGFNLMEQHPNPPTPVRTSSIRSTQSQVGSPGSHHGSGQHLVYPPHPKVNGDGNVGRKTTNLDTQLAILRREMYSLRQQDLSLLSQLWSLNESIQDFRQILQDQEDRVLSPPSPSPSPSSADEEEFYMSATSVGFNRPSSGIHGRRMSGSSAASGSLG